MNVTDLRCEVCGGQPVTCMVRDLQEITPPGSNHLCWTYYGGPHHFCKEHERPSRRYRLDGRVEESSIEIGGDA